MIRLSVIPYLNALPLVHQLAAVSPDVQIIQTPPSAAMELLDNSEVDMALVPIVDCLKRSDLYRVPGLGICAKGPVTSVLLQCDGPINTVQAIRSDPSSKTSNCLARVLCHFHWQVSPEFVGPQDRADARVLIGDAALTSCPSHTSYDLSEHWHQFTGLPFVFAVWVCRSERSDLTELANLVHQAYDRSRQMMPALAAEGAKRLGLVPGVCERYLTACLHYEMGPSEERALVQFKQYIDGLSQAGLSGLSSPGTAIQGGRPHVKAC
jgi:chorismate dehydratase